VGDLAYARDNIETNIKEIWFEGVDWIRLTLQALHV
jgi:hypothetical protein